jgi:AGZA family xanthine/uracil permease-like MFS transporter
LGLVPFYGVVGPPPSVAPTLAQLDVRAAFRPDLVPVIFILFFLGLFDTVGTLVGVAMQAGFMTDGQLPRARQAMATDAAGTIVGTVLGTSTVTAFVESAAGVQAGARTGLANVMTAGLLLVALFVSPLARSAGEGIHVGQQTLYPIVAPALILVGSFMIRSVSRIDLGDPPAAFASFVTLVAMPFTFSITEGIAFGFIAYVLLMLAVGRARQVHPLLFVFAALFVLRYVFLT